MGCLKLTYQPTLKVVSRTSKNVALARDKSCAGGYQYKFQGQERQDELGLAVYDYGARNYDPALGRWMNIDPLAEKFSIMTPYAYVAGNPIMFVDPDGKDITLPKGTSRENTLRVLGSLQKLTNDKLVYSTQKDGSIKGNV